MSTIVVFQPDARARARLRDALASDYDLRPVDTWAELFGLAETTPVAACIVDLHAPGETLSPVRLGQLRSQRPDLAIVVYSDFSRDRLDPFELGRHGIDAVIDAGDDDPILIRDTVARSLGSATAGAVANDLEGRLPVFQVEALRWAVENAARPSSAEALARAMGMSRAGLAQELRSVKAPPARQLLLWGRLLRAARLLDGGGTIEATALKLGYASGSGLQRAFRRSVGFPPGDVAIRGGLDSVLNKLLESAQA